jgi:hypothetical protein
MIWQVAPQPQPRQLFNVRAVKRYASVSLDVVTDGLTRTNSLVVSTYEPGLVPGDLLAVTSANLGLVVAEYEVQELALTWANATTILYTATCGDAPIRLAGTHLP